MVDQEARKSSGSKSEQLETGGKGAREFRVSDHIYVPKHEVLSPAEADEVYRRYHATPAQFPYILASDPALKELNAKPGDLIKITRKSGTAGESVYYRVVVKG